MNYVVKGKLTKAEYYKIIFLKQKFAFFLVLLLSFIIGNMQIEFKQLFTVSFLAEYGDIVLNNWLIVILLMGSPILILVLIIAFTNKRKYLGCRKYTFLEEGIFIQTEVENIKVPWEILILIKKKRSYHVLSFSQVLLFSQIEEVYLMDRFFDSSQHADEIISYIKKMKGEKK